MKAFLKLKERRPIVTNTRMAVAISDNGAKVCEQVETKGAPEYLAYECVLA